MKRNRVLEITVDDTELGMNWKLILAGKTIAGGYSKNLWVALDDANESLGSFATHVTKIRNPEPHASGREDER